jgi:hypothetical protein
VLALLLGFTQGLATLATGTALALLAWNLYRARQELAAAWTAAHRLDRPRKETPP